MTNLELLAPAKNLECGLAAIDHGADAVYIGAPRFGARAAVGNSVDDIRQLCQYAHQFDVRVYVTVNTIIYDDELEPVKQLIRELEEVGVDAVLVQDMGILEMRNDDHSFPFLHASTQTDNRTPCLMWNWKCSCMVLCVSVIADSVMPHNIVFHVLPIVEPVPSSVA